MRSEVKVLSKGGRIGKCEAKSLSIRRNAAIDHKGRNEKKMKNMPLLSIIMSVYNAEKYLKESIQSILNQSYARFELIIIEDGSTDGSIEIIERFADERIRLIRHEKNRGIAVALNRGIREARGEWIVRMDADDVAMPGRLEKQLEYVEKNAGVDGLFTTVERIDESGKALPPWEIDRECIDFRKIGEILPLKNCLAHPTAMIRAKLLKAQGYSAKVPGGEDYHLWLRLLSEGRILAKIDEALLRYRIHPRSITQQSRNGRLGLRKNIRVKSLYLWERCRTGGCSEFDRKVLHGWRRDITVYFKTLLKAPLRRQMMRLGRGFGKIAQKKIEESEIVFFFSHAGVGGAEQVQKDILESAKAFRTVTILSSKSRENRYLTDYRRYSKIWDLSRFSEGILGRWLTAGYLASLLERSQVRTVFGSRSGLFYDLLIAIDAEKKGTKFVDLFHACDDNMEYYSLEAVPRIDRRIVIDSATKECVEALYRERGLDAYIGHLSLRENGVKIPESMPERSGAIPLSLYVGRDAPVKRIHLIRRVAECLPDFPFLLAGVEGPENESGNLRPLGLIDDLSSLYTQADILLLSSSREGFPMVIMEAMAYGVIPVCTDVGGISRHIVDGVNGFLITEREEDRIVEAFVQRIKRLKTDKALRRRMADAAYRYARNHFDIRRFRRGYREFFAEISGEQL